MTNWKNLNRVLIIFTVATLYLIIASSVCFAIKSTNAGCGTPVNQVWYSIGDDIYAWGDKPSVLGWYHWQLTCQSGDCGPTIEGDIEITEATPDPFCFFMFSATAANAPGPSTAKYRLDFCPVGETGLTTPCGPGASGNEHNQVNIYAAESEPEPGTGNLVIFKSVTGNCSGVSFTVTVTDNIDGYDLNASATFTCDNNGDPVLSLEGLEPGDYIINENSVTGWQTQPTATVTVIANDSVEFTVTNRRITPSTAIPTLSEWGMIIMSLLIAGSAVWMIRRRQMV